MFSHPGAQDLILPVATLSDIVAISGVFIGCFRVEGFGV